MRSLSGLAAAYGFHLHAGRIFRCVLWIRFVPCRTSFGRFSHRTVYIQSTKPVAWLAMRPLRGLKFRLPAKNRLDQFIGLAFIEGGFGRDFIAIDVFDASFSRRP